MAASAAPTGRRLEKTRSPGIFKRGGQYVVVYRDPQGRQRKRAVSTMAEARDVKATLHADVARGEFRALSRVAFSDYAADWIRTYQGRTSRGLGEGTRQDYAGALGLDCATGQPLEPTRGAVAFFGRTPLAAIEPRDVKRYVTDLASGGLAPASVAKAVAPVRALLATALEEGLLRSNPAAGLRIARRLDDEDTEQVKALTEDELRELLEGAGDSRLFFEFLSQTALRIGEAIEVRHGDVDGCWLNVERRFYRGTVGKPKGRKTRRIRLTEEMARQLWTLRKDNHAAADDLVFTAERGGRLIPSNLMSRVLKPAAVEAGLGVMVKAAGKERAETWVGFHTLRHTCATMLFRHGWNAVQVQKFLGHSDPGFTLRTYVHLLPEDLPSPEFLATATAEGGNKGATRPPETAGDAPVVAQAVSAL